jgi:hypothetical protein
LAGTRKKHPGEYDTPQSKEFLKAAQDYEIEMCITEGAIVNGKIPVTVSIEDKGTGISKVDLKHITSTGSSSKNWARKRIIQEMPIWLKPSGTFGIGFQSVFMMTDKVELKTKSFFTEELKHIELYAPNSKRRGEILIKPIRSNHSRKPGTKLVFAFETEPIPQNWEVPGSFKTTMQILHAYDPFSSTSMNISLGMIIDEITQFSEYCSIPIVLTYNDMRTEAVELRSTVNREFKYYDNENSLEFIIKPLEYSSKPQSGSMRAFYYYKGQSIDAHSVGFKFLAIWVNIHSDDAGNYISIDRIKLKPNIGYQVRRMVLTSSFRIIRKNFDEIFPSENDKIIGSMYLNYYTEEVDPGVQVRDDEYPQWKAQVLPDNVDFTLIRMINEIKNIVIIERGHKENPYERDFGDNYQIEGDTLNISIRDVHSPDFFITEFILILLDRYYRFGKITEINGCECYHFRSNSFDDVITFGGLKKVLGELQSTHNNRNIIPCMAKYSPLKINTSIPKDYVGKIGFGLLNYLSDVPQMLAPYKTIRHSEIRYSAIVNLNENMIEWVYENRKDLAVTKDQVKETYQKFISDFEDTIPKEQNT